MVWILLLGMMTFIGSVIIPNVAAACKYAAKLFSDAEALEDTRDHVLARGTARELAERGLCLLDLREHDVRRHARDKRLLRRADAFKRTSDGFSLTGVRQQRAAGWRRGIKRADSIL